MDIIVSGRHVSVTEGMKSHLVTRLDSILDGVPVKLSSTRAILDVEKNRHKVEVILHMKGHEIEATDMSYDMYASIDSCCDKVEKQLKKYIDKLQSHKGSFKEIELAHANEKTEIDHELDVLDELMEETV